MERPSSISLSMVITKTLNVQGLRTPKTEGDDPTPEADVNAAATPWKEAKAFLQKH
jgi:hypothetical protein